MAEWYVIYTKDGCQMCLRTKELLQVMGTDYYEEILPDKDDWIVPTVFLEEDYIGGYNSLQKHFNKRITNGSKKKQRSH